VPQGTQKKNTHINELTEKSEYLIGQPVRVAKPEKSGGSSKDPENCGLRRSVVTVPHDRQAQAKQENVSGRQKDHARGGTVLVSVGLTKGQRKTGDAGSEKNTAQKKKNKSERRKSLIGREGRDWG